MAFTKTGDEREGSSGVFFTSEAFAEALFMTQQLLKSSVIVVLLHMRLDTGHKYRED